MLSQKSNKVLCTCSKCKQQDTEQDVNFSSSESKSSQPIDEPLNNANFSIHENWTNMVDRGDDKCNFTDVENELTSDSPTNESSDSEDSLENMSDFDEELSDEMSCALKLLDIKSHCNIKVWCA
ncbi:19376_t:CDS:2 [Rhizophagus irregularis]|nr:19376_t:CDS:2 [Rhizophagus irregularis]